MRSFLYITLIQNFYFKIIFKTNIIIKIKNNVIPVILPVFLLNNFIV